MSKIFSLTFSFLLWLLRENSMQQPVITKPFFHYNIISNKNLTKPVLRIRNLLINSCPSIFITFGSQKPCVSWVSHQGQIITLGWYSFLFPIPALSSIHAPRPQTGALLLQCLPWHLATTFNLKLTRVSPELEVQLFMHIFVLLFRLSS